MRESVIYFTTACKSLPRKHKCVKKTWLPKIAQVEKWR